GVLGRLVPAPHARLQPGARFGAGVVARPDRGERDLRGGARGGALGARAEADEAEADSVGPRGGRTPGGFAVAATSAASGAARRRLGPSSRPPSRARWRACSGARSPRTRRNLPACTAPGPLRRGRDGCERSPAPRRRRRRGPEARAPRAPALRG